MIIQLTGKVNEHGDLVFETPKNLPPGEVKITIEVHAEDQVDDQSSDDETFTPEEVAELLKFGWRSGAEVVAEGLTGGWEDMGIEDSVEWTNELRRKIQERHKW